MLGVVAFGVTIPSSPGYFGVIQFCFMTSLRLFTDDQASVFAASVYYHLSQYIPVTIVGLIFMGLKGMHLTDFSSGAVPESPDSSHGSAAAPTV